MGNKVIAVPVPPDAAEDLYGRLAQAEDNLTKAMTDFKMSAKLWQELRLIRNNLQSIENALYIASHQGGNE